MRTVLLAPDSFKGSIGAADACAALAQGWRSIHSDARIVLRPMADGGEGTLDAFAAAVPEAVRMPVTVTGPDGAEVEASWLLLPPASGLPGGTAVVELASTSGIELLGERRLPWDADTTGFGQAIAAALEHGVSRLVLGIGSSAATDGGAGMLTALGARFTDTTGRAIARGARGLADLHAADLTRLRPLPDGGALVLSDVTNPLCGPAGAAAVFGPQKGFAAVELSTADAALARFAHVVAAATSGERVDPSAAGTGAAGGTGFALRAWGARLVPGSAEVARLAGLADAFGDADVVVTGEGSYDRQSAAGKAPAYVAALARAANVPVALVAGRIAPDADVSAFAATASLTELAGGTQAALADPARWLRAAGRALALGFARHA